MKRFEIKLFIGVLFILAITAFRFVQVADDRTVELIGILAAVVLGVLGARPMNWIKGKFGVENGTALLLVYALSAIVAGVALAVAGQFTSIIWSVEGVIAFGAVFFSAAQAAYQRLK